MKANHTPGPWTLDDIFGDGNFDVVLGYQAPKFGNPILLAKVFADEDDSDASNPTRRSAATANAQLIAAAPELYNAAKSIESVYRLVEVSSDNLVDALERLRSVVRLCESAIEKAETGIDRREADRTATPESPNRRKVGGVHARPIGSRPTPPPAPPEPK